MLKARGKLPEDWTLTQCLFGEHLLQQNATAADREAHIDIADWLLRYMYGPAPMEEEQCHAEFLKAAEFVSADKHEELEALIRDLGLEFVRAEPISSESPP